MRESRVWSWFELHRPPWFAVERIEALYPPGLADCFWTDQRHINGRGTSGWLELKYCDILPATNVIPKLRPEQPLFLSRQARHDVPSGILLREGTIGWHLWVAEGTMEWTVRVQDGIRPTGRWTFKVFTVEALMECLLHYHYHNMRYGGVHAPRETGR